MATREKSPTPRELGYRFPAEWEPQEATWLAWPFPPKDWFARNSSIGWTFASIARHLSETERVRVLVSSAKAARNARRTLVKSGVHASNITFHSARTNRTWTRDYLPLFLVKPGARFLGAVKWHFNGWARWPGFSLDNAAGHAIAGRTGGPVWTPEATFAGRRQKVVLEGGAVDTDGEGTVMVTEECLAGGKHSRNPGLGKAGTSAVLFDHLAADEVIWLPNGIDGDDTTGHIDAIARFVAPGRVVLCQEKNRRDGNHRKLAANRERLEGAKDARGRRIEVVPLPMPAPVRDGRLRYPATYANFLIANGTILAPTFDDPLDREALGILSELFPDRRVIGIHARHLVHGGGTIHCSTMQEPALQKRKSRVAA